MPDIRRLLHRAIRLAGGTQSALGEAIGTSQNAIYEAIRRGRVSAEMACAIHRATDGEIPVWALRPDLWAVGQPPPPQRRHPCPDAKKRRKPKPPPPATTAPPQ